MNFVLVSILSLTMLLYSTVGYGHRTLDKTIQRSRTHSSSRHLVIECQCLEGPLFSARPTERMTNLELK